LFWALAWDPLNQKKNGGLGEPLWLGGRG